jgi:GntR family transcriptional regulator
VSLQRVPVPLALQVTMGLAAGALVDRAVRVRRVQGEAFAYYLSHTRVQHGSDRLMTAKSLQSQTRLELFRAMGVKLAEVDQLLSAQGASADIAQHLGVRAGTPLLSVVRTYIDHHGVVIDHLHGQYRPDRFQYHMHLSTGRKS